MASEHGERIPLTIADYDRTRGTVTLVIQAVGKTTREMQQHFTKAADAKGESEGPVIVASLGGFTTDAFVSPAEREAMYDRVAAGLARAESTRARVREQDQACRQTLRPDNLQQVLAGQAHAAGAECEQRDRRQAGEHQQPQEPRQHR